MYVHVTDGVVDQVGRPPRLGFDGTRWWDLRTGDPTALAALSWYPVTEAPRPADTATTTWDPTYTLEPGGVAQQGWVERDKTPAEISAEQVIVNGEVIKTQALAAMEGNRAFLALSPPTNAQTLAQVRALTRQNQGLIRIALGLLDGTD